MKLSCRSPFWNWKEVVEWLYHNKLIGESEVEKAKFLEDVNAVLEERDPKIRENRHRLQSKLNFSRSLNEKTDSLEPRTLK